jgi:hypothetical protein
VGWRWIRPRPTLRYPDESDQENFEHSRKTSTGITRQAAGSPKLRTPVMLEVIHTRLIIIDSEAKNEQEIGNILIPHHQSTKSADKRQ